MALHISGKLCVIGIVIAALITAFSAPPLADRSVEVSLTPTVTVLAAPRETTLARQVVGPVANPVFKLRATGYNSLASQTDATPHITAIGTRTRFGIIAVSRDLLSSDIPYGSLVRIKDLGSYHGGRGAGAFQALLDSQGVFIVEDTMHARKRNQIDVWFPGRGDALSWGVRQVEVEVVRYGYSGPELYGSAPDFDATPRLAAIH